MSTKVKGLLKGLRYISHIFEEEKEPEMQIGLPTDVKHVAHIGWDGPSIDSPSWMKEFPSHAGFQSAPLAPPGELGEDPEIKWVSADSGRANKSTNSPRRDLPELPKSSRRHASSAENNSNDSPINKDSSAKSRHSRRHYQSKDSSDGGSVKSTRRLQESSQGTSSPQRDLPDIPKKSRRKKSKESVSGGGSTKSRTKGTNSNGTHAMDPGTDSGSALRNPSCRMSSIPSIQEDADESRVKSNGY